ncbi:MAG TPA: SRPBCC domain-containing protein [Chloroflexia bacterium]|nr:SRPBCC domain-containing protein [Chloroflexia bacterium]
MISEAERGQATRFDEVVQAAPEEVYRFFTAPAAMRVWLCDTAEADPRVGGRLYLWWNRGYYSAGTYTELVPGERVAFTWRGPDDPAPSQVRVELAPDAEGSTRISIAHEGEASGEWGGWQDALENLKSAVETGIDLRLARRPMFGIMGADVVTAENAEQFGVPEPTGLRLSMLVDTMAARKAGIREGDTVIALGDHPVSDFYTFTNAMQAHRAGDRVPVTLYRDGEKQVITVELGAREMPKLPATTADLSGPLREACDRINRELAEAMEGVTEEEASYRPGPREWGVREVIGHLTSLEHDTQAYIASLIEDDQAPVNFHSNVFERVSAITQVQGTVPELVEQFRRALEASALMVESLPEETMARKAGIMNLAVILGGFEDHARGHIEEMKALVAKARGEA